MGTTSMWAAFTLAVFLLVDVKGATTPADPTSSTVDATEGQDVRLECRFTPRSANAASTLYWIRANRNGHDNVAIGNQAYQANYTVDHRPDEGAYDLLISGSTYDRDNGRFECKLKEAVSGTELYSSVVDLTVLLKPSPPVIAPAESASFTESAMANLTCSSTGGSPPPEIAWFRAGSDEPLQAEYMPGRNKDVPTVSVLKMMPAKEDDGAVYKCTVWNRAIGKEDTMEVATTIFVDYFPRIVVGPENPVRVEQDSVAQLECTVDSKPSVSSVKWTRNGRFIDTHFKHTIPRASVEDAGEYICAADNGLGKIVTAELVLDVLHAPTVTLPESVEARHGDEFTLECQVSANPAAASVAWTKQGDASFSQSGSTLRLANIEAAHNSVYTCSATNYVQPTGGERSVRTANASVSVNVRHAPGPASILPEKPTAVDGKSVTLTCKADPPGFPKPTFSWWREDGSPMATGEELTIEQVRLSHAGKYFCQANNELGSGSAGSASLDVFQAPKIITQLQPTIMKRAGDTGFHITCSAVAKPKPSVRWFKDGQEIMADDSKSYEIATSETETESSATTSSHNVLSTLKFVGQDRIGDASLLPSDRGHYTCQFENGVASSETTMLLRIEHSPIVVHSHNKVAFDLGETAVITCKMQAYPALKLDWSFGNSMLQSDRDAYDSNVTALDDDIFEGALTVRRVTEADFGDYICKGTNSMGAKRTIIKLQPKGKPEAPVNVNAVATGADEVTLAWDEGFDGGYNNTMFTVQYRRADDNVPRYQDCRHYNPCNISGLNQHTQYQVRVKASNIRGESKFSREVPVITKVDASLIPAPDNVHYATKAKSAFFQASGAQEGVPLVAKVELENADGTWSHYEQVSLGASSSGKVAIAADAVSNVRVRLCVQDNDVLCGPYANADIVEVSPSVAAAASEPWVIAVVVVVVVIGIVAIIIVVKCCCCNNRQSHPKKKERPEIVHTTQPPTSPYSFGLENKGVDTVKDDLIKNNIYSVQNGYQYEGPHGYPAPHTNAANSNSNSANGGSVNSQDSLWNVKAGGVPMPMTVPQQQQAHHPDDYAHYPYPEEYLNDRNQQYLVNDVYGHIANRNVDNADYAAYGNLHHMDPYMNQQYNNVDAYGQPLEGYAQQQHHQDAYGQHGDVYPQDAYGQHGDAYGQHGDAYGQHMEAYGQQQQQHQQQQQGHLDASQDEDFSPNARSRRIIREIIV